MTPTNLDRETLPEMNKGNEMNDLQQEQEQQRQQSQYQYQNQYQQKRIFDVTEGIRAKKTEVTYQRIFKHFLKHVKINDLEVLLDYSRTRPRIIREIISSIYVMKNQEKN